MKEGRMKGQAFIGLPNEKAAAKALKEANGYILFGKPMVVVSFKSVCSKTYGSVVFRSKGIIETNFYIILHLNSWHSSLRILSYKYI